MRKNLLSIIILALLIVNIVLTSIMMFSVTGAAQKTSSLVNEVMNAVNMEKGVMVAEGDAAAAEQPAVAIKDTAFYDIPDAMTINLKTSSDGSAHFAIVQITLSMNSKHKEYKTYGEGDLSTYDGLIREAIINVFGRYAIEDINVDRQVVQEEIKKEILAAIQNIYDSDFIYNVAIKDVQYQ